MGEGGHPFRHLPRLVIRVEYFSNYGPPLFPVADTCGFDVHKGLEFGVFHLQRILACRLHDRCLCSALAQASVRKAERKPEVGICIMAHRGHRAKGLGLDKSVLLNGTLALSRLLVVRSSTPNAFGSFLRGHKGIGSIEYHRFEPRAPGGALHLYRKLRALGRLMCPTA